jgi:hypothetical protein
VRANFKYRPALNGTRTCHYATNSNPPERILSPCSPGDSEVAGTVGSTYKLSNGQVRSGHGPSLVVITLTRKTYTTPIPRLINLPFWLALSGLGLSINRPTGDPFWGRAPWTAPGPVCGSFLRQHRGSLGPFRDRRREDGGTAGAGLRCAAGASGATSTATGSGIHHRDSKSQVETRVMPIKARVQPAWNLPVHQGADGPVTPESPNVKPARRDSPIPYFKLAGKWGGNPRARARFPIRARMKALGRSRRLHGLCSTGSAVPAKCHSGGTNGTGPGPPFERLELISSFP